MPCDHDFGQIEKQGKDRVVGPLKWVRLIKETDQADPFSIVYVEHPVTDDMIDNGTPVVKAKNYKGTFYLRAPNAISAIRGILFKLGKGPLCRYSMTEECHIPLICLKCGSKMRSLISKSRSTNLYNAYSTFLPIKEAKLKDVCDLLQHVTVPAEMTFYANLRAIDNAGQDHDKELE